MTYGLVLLSETFVNGVCSVATISVMEKEPMLNILFLSEVNRSIYVLIL